MDTAYAGHSAEENGECNSQDGFGGLDSIADQSRIIGSYENSTFYPNCSRRDYDRQNSFNSQREASSGGILGQLRELQESHLAYVRGHEERLEARLKEAQRHQRKITEDMQRLEIKILELLQEDKVEEHF